MPDPVDETHFSNFAIAALVSFLGQSFCVFMQKRGRNSMPVRLLWKWSAVLAFASLVGLLIEYFAPSKPFAVSLAMALTIVALFDTIWTRMAVAAFSAAMPRRFIMPQQVESAWQPGRHFYDLKRSIEKAGFEKRLSLRSNFPGRDDVLELSTYFLSKDGKTMLCVSFARARAEFQTFFSLTSRRTDGALEITTNQSAADGLRMPPEFRREIRPWTRSFEKLLACHNSKLSSAELEAMPSPTPQSLWEVCLKIEKENVRCGILTPTSEIGRYGILTSDGKYKLWMDTLLLSYFAIMPKN